MCMDKKTFERNCLEKTNNYIPYATSKSKKILSLLLGQMIESESPDFIIKNQECNIGVEHFLVDTLLGKKKASRSRTKASESIRTYNKYHDDIDEKAEEALKDIERIAQSEIDAIQNFSYEKFITEFDRISKEHLNKVDEYRNADEKIDKLIFLIEMPIAKNKMIGFDEYFNSIEIKGRKIPFTLDMLRILMEISNKVDFIVLSVMREDYKKCPYMVYAIDSKDFVGSIESQIPDVFRRFTYDWQTYPFKTKVDLKLERNEKD